jgi:hypothetical protein
MGKPEAQDLLEEMRWKYGRGPLPSRRRKALERQAALGCVIRLVVAFAFCVGLLLVARRLW